MTHTDTTPASAGLALDAPTLIAAAITAGFAVVAGIAIGNLPQDGSLGGALDAIKNIVYMITVPMFDLTRRAFSRRGTRGTAATPTVSGPADRRDPPDLLRVAFLSALVVFILIEIIAWLMGFATGLACIQLGHQIENGTFGQCLTVGVAAYTSVLMAPLMVMIAMAAGWIWRGLVPSRFWLTLLIFLIVIAGLFGLDYFIMLQQTAAGTEQLRETYIGFGPLRQVGLQIALLTPGVLIGYGARKLWQSVTRRFG